MNSLNTSARILLYLTLCVSLLIAANGRSWAQVDEQPVSPADERVSGSGSEEQAEPTAPVHESGLPQRIELAPLRGSTAVRGRLAPAEVTHYLVHGTPGQTLHVTLDAVPPVAYFSLFGVEDRRPYKPLPVAPAISATGGEYPGQDASSQWSVILPSDQDYLLSVATADTATEFALSLESTAPESLFPLDPARYHPPRDRTAGVVSGRVGNGTDHRYLVHATAGQLLNLEMKAEEPHVFFGVQGVLDGRTQKWQYDDLRTWSFIAPVTQDYLVTVMADGDPAAYSLTITLP